MLVVRTANKCGMTRTDAPQQIHVHDKNPMIVAKVVIENAIEAESEIADIEVGRRAIREEIGIEVAENRKGIPIAQESLRDGVDEAVMREAVEEMGIGIVGEMEIAIEREVSLQVLSLRTS